ncbi:uncharacterized protein DNG_08446 [Cephalotrichum gorgonifer]|uniref:BHLH domain-containing protein n=1 Tax=Cephalotrichum gorgonifer TaxID=2041049 RepID=A0AAE8SYD8_9PEZI|nr:uncharacterized protein DNG_08446 [Cephalotrichum gorgonifer]
MLALQRERMNTKQPPDSALPFGYLSESLGHRPGHLTDNPPEPPSGAPLLSEHETLDLQNWLGNVANPRLFAESYGEGMPFDMLELAPELLGSATSYGRESDMYLDSSPSASSYQFMSSGHDMSPSVPGGSGVMPPPPPPPPPAHHPHSPLSHHPGLNGHPTPDVVAAASLLQNGPTGNNHFHHDLGLGSLGEMGPMGLMALSQHGQTLSRGQNHGSGRQFSGDHGGHFQQQQAAAPQSRTPKMRWGSDASFGHHQGFVAPSAKDTLEAISQGQLDLLGCLHVNNSAATTRPSSPTAGLASPNKTHSRRASSYALEVNEPDGPPRKRQKSRGNEEGASPSSAASVSGTAKASRRRKTNADADSASPIAEEAEPSGAADESVDTAAPRQRRRKSSNAKKPTRENLTDEQKRENHIRSEQKRRTIIREGFAEISAIVPKLRGGGYSKSNMLQAAADWLEKLINSNAMLREELAKVGP